MHFSEVINPKKYPKGLLTIPDDEFQSVIYDWAHAMGKSCGYRKQTRMEHWQEAIDSVYTALEAKLQDIDTNRIMSEKKWEIMMLAAKLYFPEHIGLYHPTPVEQQRTRQLVKNSQYTRHMKNKAELMKLLKEDKDLGVSTLAELAVSRLQCEVLATSAEILLNEYKGGLLNKPTLTAEAGTSVEAQAKASASLGGTASASASVGASASAGYDSGQVGLGHGWKNRLHASAGTAASAATYANASAQLGDLTLSANAGLGAETTATANIDYEATHSCKVKVGYLRRLLGPEFKTIEGRIGASATANAGASANASASVSGDASFGHIGSSGESVAIASASAGAEVEIAVKLNGKIGCTVGQTLDVDVTGDLYGGASAGGSVEFLVNGQEVGMSIGGKAMAGFEVGSSQKFTLKHPSRNISIFSVKFHETFSAGAGISGSIDAKASLDQCSFDTSAGATLGVGSSIGASSVLSPRGALLLGYDLIAVPSVIKIGEVMARHHSGPHTQRMTKLCDYLNKQASKGEINQVYMDNQNRIAGCLAALNADAERLYKTDCRVPGFAGYTEATKEELAEGVSGSSESKYHEYTTETLKTAPLSRVFGSEADAGNPNITFQQPIGQGMIGQTVEQEFIISQRRLQGDQLATTITSDKEELQRVVRAYEQAKTHGSGQCVAYQVLKKDLLEGVEIKY